MSKQEQAMDQHPSFFHKLRSAIGEVKFENLLFVIAVMAMFILVAYPVFALLFRSLGVWPSLTLDNYYKLARFGSPFMNSILLASITSIIDFLIAIPMAWFCARTDMPFKNIITTLVVVSFAVPSLLKAAGYTILLGPNAGWINVFATNTFGHSIFNIYTFEGVVFVTAIHNFPYIFLTCLVALQAMDPSLEDSARMLGLGKIRVLLNITLPIILPAITAGIILVFVESLSMFGPPIILGVPAGVRFLTTDIFAQLQAFPPDFGAATSLSVLTMSIAAIVLFLQVRFLRLGQKEYTTITGRGLYPRIINLGFWKYPALLFSSVILLLSLFMPFGALLFASLSKTWLQYAGFSLGGLTLAHYQYVLTSAEFLSSLSNSLILATGSATICMLLGAVVAYIIVRTKIRGQKIVLYLSTIPNGIPPTVLGVALIFAWGRPPFFLEGTLLILFLAYVGRSIPFSTRTASSALWQLDRELEEGCRIIGGSWFETFKQIILPLIKGGLLGGWALVFMSALREVGATILLYSVGSKTASVVFVNHWDYGDIEVACTMAMIMLFVSIVSLVIVQRMTGKNLTELI